MIPPPARERDGQRSADTTLSRSSELNPASFEGIPAVRACGPSISSPLTLEISLDANPARHEAEALLLRHEAAGPAAPHAAMAVLADIPAIAERRLVEGYLAHALAQPFSATIESLGRLTCGTGDTVGILRRCDNVATLPDTPGGGSPGQ
jgi:hypothetical protein